MPDHYVIPHTAAGKMLVGGPSNAGGLFLNWATSMLARHRAGRRPRRGAGVGAVPPGRARPATTTPTAGPCSPASTSPTARVRCAGPRSRRRASSSAAHARRHPGRVAPDRRHRRRHPGRRVGAGAGRLHRDARRLRRRSRGGALGSAWLARIAAGLEEPMAMTEGRRWARTGRTVDPDARLDRADGRPLRGVEVARMKPPSLDRLRAARSRCRTRPGAPPEPLLPRSHPLARSGLRPGSRPPSPTVRQRPTSAAAPAVRGSRQLRSPAAKRLSGGRQRVAEDPGRVLVGDRRDLGVGQDPAVDLLEHGLGVGPGAVAVRVVGLEADVLDADDVPGRDRRRVVDRAEPEVAAQDVARPVAACRRPVKYRP